MNLFRSEEHVHNWVGFKPGTEDGIRKLSTVAELFSGNLFTRRLDPDYVSHMNTYLEEFVTAVSKLGPFWQASVA